MVTCERDECNKEASFAEIGCIRARFCKHHKEHDMVDVKSKKCERDGCKKRASFAEKGCIRARFCTHHKEHDMVNVKSKKCEIEGCQKQPSFAEKGSTRARFCKYHKEHDMVNVTSRKCEIEGCEIQPRFCGIGCKQPRFCTNHKEPNMVDLYARICEKDGCQKQASFGEKGCSKRKFCNEHRQSHMVNLFSIKCERDGCHIQPSFSDQGCTRPRFCYEHKEKNMVDVRSRTCEREGCQKHPYFGDKGSTRRRFCKLHREPHMIKVIQLRTCDREGCEIQPRFGDKGSKVPIFCKKHKERDMVDIYSKACAVDGCDTRAFYGIPGEKASSCGKHYSIGMIAFPRRKCSEESCKNIGTHGNIAGGRSRFCEDHAPHDYVDIVQKKCSSCGLLDVLRGGLCSDCDPEIRYVFEHAKENRIRDVFDSRGFVYCSHDKVVDGGYCNMYRPDFIFDATTHFVVVEVDENQHKGRPSECERNRMLSIWQSLGLYTIFLRYNPDNYEPRYTSNPMVRGKQREGVLCSWLSHLIKPDGNPLSRGNACEVFYLYYDDHDDSCIIPKCLAEMEA
jgi:hypothetical protein